MLNYFVEQSVNALSLGGTYALLALGLAVVYSILGNDQRQRLETDCALAAAALETLLRAP